MLNPASQTALKAYVGRPSHGLLLFGLSGVGLRTVAESIARQLDEDISLITIEPDDKGKISIETIHELTPKLRSVRRHQPLALIIDDAERMTRPAQDAFLKSLEEPTEGVYFILTSHQPDNLLATVSSRVAKLEIRPVSKADSLDLIKRLGQFDDKAVAQLMFIASGRPAELTRLTADTDYFDVKAKLVADAKALVSANAYDRLKIVSRYEKSRTSAVELLANL
ncbi:MAG TPA: AAA family ATPase, partial [Candidatus Saccharimonadales bacterium]|nr:AAA family ATPase [Candidatus Saccharimonadales bacterium]